MIRVCPVVLPRTTRVTLARPLPPSTLITLALYLSVAPRPPQGMACSPRGRPYRTDSQCSLPSRIGLMRMRLSGDGHSQERVHARPLFRSGVCVPLRPAASAWSLPLSPAARAAAARDTSTRTCCYRETGCEYLKILKIIEIIGSWNNRYE